MSLSLRDVRKPDATPFGRPDRAPSDALGIPSDAPKVFAFAAWHSLFWLFFANAVGVLIATLLLVPALNRVLGEWTYGRWMLVHLNLELYGWCSLPLLAFLFKVYGADREPAAKWCRPALWVWSTALGIGALSWLTGHSSGKLFLDWSGYPRILFPLALAVLWLVLVLALVSEWNATPKPALSARSAKLIGLVLLSAVPILIYLAASPSTYPPINPDTGGPSGASQLESTLVTIAILLQLPFGLTHRKTRQSWQTTIAWSIFAAETLLCIALGRADVSHHLPIQYLSLGSLLVWLPLTPIYYSAFEWRRNTRRWRIAFLCWWSALVPTGWCLFLPGVLDHFKFTDGLVGHSLLAMAGFVTSLLIFVLVQILGEDGWIFNGTRSFYAWQGAVLAFILLMTFSGWREGLDPSFAIVPSTARNAVYLLRLLCGILMLLASGGWLLAASRLLRYSPFPRSSCPPEQAS